MKTIKPPVEDYQRLCKIYDAKWEENKHQYERKILTPIQEALKEPNDSSLEVL